MSNRIESLTGGVFARNLNLVTIAELCANRTEAYTAGLSWYKHTAGFPNCDFGVWAFSLYRPGPKYRIPFREIQPVSELFRIDLDRLNT